METNKFHQLQTKIYQYYNDRNFELANKLAAEYLELAKSNLEDWNYGNAIHHGNLILGRISLKNGQIEEAKKYLIKAGMTPGSPQLNSFGPNMTLAKELLELGESKIVVEYIEKCSNFWNFLFSWLKIRSWRRDIKKGKIPNFGANLDY